MKLPLHLITILRWTARIVGGLVVLLIVAIAIGEGVPNPFHQPARVNACGLALIVTIIGELIAWKREGVGGTLILAGLAGFAIANRGLAMNAVFAPLLLTGVLYSLCAWCPRVGGGC